MTFDTKRNRLLLWNRALVAVDLLRKKATEIAQASPEVRAITYSQADDLIYACCAPHDGKSNNTVSEIRSYNHRGAELSRVKLNVPIRLGYGALDASVKLKVIEGKLLIAKLRHCDADGHQMSSDTNYVVNPKTGDLLFACRRVPR